ncbi:hypothetical protein PC116_g22044 [Phytophthora cactorum]|nr:hypothetical protein PC116_g22044 [Phytophthora cactorum]
MLQGAPSTASEYVELAHPVRLWLATIIGEEGLFFNGVLLIVLNLSLLLKMTALLSNELAVSTFPSTT